MTKNEKLNPAHYLLKLPFFYKAAQKILNKESGKAYVYNEFLNIQKSDRVLDIGCGPARMRTLMPTEHYTGIDFNDDHITAARQKHPQDTFITGDITKYNFNDFGKFDKILMIGILHHIPDNGAEKILQTTKTLLKDNGQLLIIDPVFEKKQNPIARFLAKMDQGNHVRYAKDYETLIGRTFLYYNSFIRRDLLRFPYSHFLTKAGITSAPD